MIGIFYGSSTGNTETLAKEIAEKLVLPPTDVFDIGRTAADKTACYDILLLGSSTWGLGDLQDDWYNFVQQLKGLNLSGKKVALFGCGDSSSYPDTFCDAIGIIREELSAAACEFIGEMDPAGYPVTDSRAFEGGKVLGLIADDDQPEQTAERLEKWTQIIKSS